MSRKKTRGIFITFEGGEGSGKSTQIQKLASTLKKAGCPVLLTREPGGTPVGNHIRKILLDEGGRIPLQRELFLYELARRDHVKEVIEPALRRGQVVLCDRFTDSTIAYQGYGRGHPIPLLKTFNEIATGGRRPDLTFLIHLPAKSGLARSRKRLARQHSREGRFEALSLPFHQRVQTGYLTLAAKEKKRFRIIDGRGTKQEVFDRIKQAWRQWHGVGRGPGKKHRISQRGR